MATIPQEIPSRYKLTLEERETVINGNAARRTWEVVTADPRIVRRMAKQGYKPDERDNPWGYVSFTVPFDRVRILRPEKRTMSAERKQRQSEILSNARKARNSLSGNRAPEDNAPMPVV